MQPEAIIEMIEQFCDEYERDTPSIIPGYCFEHVVLGDYNLYDSSIDLCLGKELIGEWIHQKAKDARCVPGECEWWSLSTYRDIVNYAIAATIFLNRLKSIPESYREAAMEWYHGDRG